ncbi:START domain-containing protein [Pseudomonas sp. S9]|uniref:START domain-containing protein n=1 Tax=Pseudomonas sp. S9 TaxID=686578 RepID=UPI0002556B74|nr:START domain-containing protein [Pseudomonas sp. S9]
MALFTRLLVAGVTVLAVSTAHGQDWNLVKDEAGIKVYLSDVKGSEYKAYRGVTTVKADLPTLLKLQNDVAGSCAWIHECKMQKMLKHEGDKTWIYAQFNTPWPVTPRDSVMEVTTRQDANGGATRVMHGVPDYLPSEKGFVRVSELEGRWVFTPKKAGEVEVVYEVHTEPGGSVPSWLANKFVVDAPFNTLKNYRELAEKK